MRAIALFLFIQLIIYSANAQKLYEVQFSNCPLKFTLEDTEFYIFYQPNDSIMVRDFMAEWDEKQIEKAEGYISLQLMVDTLDQVCCISYTNDLNISDKKLDIVNRVVSMPGWSRLENVLPNENLCTLVTLVFTEKEITLIRSGYNRNTGRKTLQNTVYRKFSDSSNSNLPKIDSLNSKGL